ncbi:MAG: hypothetical protein ACOC80_07040 [Petrotogales bacterium]
MEKLNEKDFLEVFLMNEISDTKKVLYRQIFKAIDETRDVRSWKTILKQKVDSIFEDY